MPIVTRLLLGLALGAAMLAPAAANAQASAAAEKSVHIGNSTKAVTVGAFTVTLPSEWASFRSSEAAALRQQYGEQSKQIYQKFFGSDDPATSVSVAAFHIAGDDGAFIIVSFSVPPESDLINLLKRQAKEKADWGIQQGYIREYLGLVPVNDNQFSGFYIRDIGKNGNVEISGALEYKKLKNTIIQLTLLLPQTWDQAAATNTLRVLLKSVALTPGPGEDLYGAAFRGDATAVKALLAKGAQVNARVTGGVTALMAAAANGHRDALVVLLDERAQINAKANDGGTALLAASMTGHREVVQALLAKGAEVNAKMNDGWTALMMASQKGHQDVVGALIDKGAEVDARASNGATALIIASQEGHLEAVQVLLRRGADVDGKDPYHGATALMAASFNGHPEVVRALVAKGADINAKDNDGVTALMKASFKGDREAVLTLLAKGADVNAKRDDGATALDAAMAGGHADIRALLVQAVDKGAGGSAETNKASSASAQNATSCVSSIVPEKNASGNYGIINFGQYEVELQEYFVCDSKGKPFQAALGQIPMGQGVLISSGEVSDISEKNIQLSIGNFHLDKAAIPWQNRPVISERLRCQPNSTIQPFKMTT